MSRTWRDEFRPIIADVIQRHRGQPLAAIRAALREAFPAGPRQYHPYKVWLDECRIQLGLKTNYDPRSRPSSKPAIGQATLF